MYGNVVPTSALRTMLADILAGTLDSCLLAPFVNDVDPGAPAVLADFTLATFVNGSTPVAVTWDTPYVDAGGRVSAIGSLCSFNYISGTAEVVYGFYLEVLSIPPALVGYARLVTPKPMATTADALDLVPRISLSASDYGSSVDVGE